MLRANLTNSSGVLSAFSVLATISSLIFVEPDALVIRERISEKGKVVSRYKLTDKGQAEVKKMRL